MTTAELEERLQELETLWIEVEVLKLRGAVLVWEISQEVDGA